MSRQARRVLVATLIMIGVTWLPVPPETPNTPPAQRASLDASSFVR